MNAEKHQVEKIKAFEHEQQLNKNALYTWAENLVENARSGRLFTTRAVGLLLAVVLVVALVIVLVRSGKSDKSRVWTEFATATNRKALTEFLDQNPKSPAALPARVQLDRMDLGPQGMDQLNSRPQRSKAIENVEKGRDEMVKRAEDAKNDLTQKVNCLKAAAEAELSLVGIETTPSSGKYRGTVEKAVEYYKQAAQAVGPTTPIGEELTKKTEQLLANRETIFMLGVQLNNQMSVSSLPPISPADLSPGKTKPDLPALPDLGPAPPTPATAVAGGAAAADTGKKDDKREEAPAPKPGEKKQ